MKIHILIMMLCIITSCTNNQPHKAAVVIEKFDSLSKEPVEEGYKPEQKIDFSHSIHAEQKATNDCKYCHTKPNTKVELNLCSDCHNVDMNTIDKFDYYVQLDSISSLVRELNK